MARAVTLGTGRQADPPAQASSRSTVPSGSKTEYTLGPNASATGDRRGRPETAQQAGWAGHDRRWRPLPRRSAQLLCYECMVHAVTMLAARAGQMSGEVPGVASAEAVGSVACGIPAVERVGGRRRRRRRGRRSVGDLLRDAAEVLRRPVRAAAEPGRSRPVRRCRNRARRRPSRRFGVARPASGD